LAGVSWHGGPGGSGRNWKEIIMANSPLPTTDAGLSDWCANADPILTSYPAIHGLTTAPVAQFHTEYLAFDAALAVLNVPATRTPVAVTVKTLAKAALLADIREMVRIIEACPTVNDEMRRALMINIRKPRAVIPAPAEAPELDILSVTGRTVRCRVHGAQANRRGKPEGVAGVAFFSFVGENAPLDASQWKLEGSSTRTTFDLSFPQNQPGDKVWLMACWYNPRLQQGPTCPAAATNLQFGSIRVAA
jgi:hypothetical protein